jgi:hypothetical protein
MSSNERLPLELSDNHHRRVASAVRTFLETIESIEAAFDLPPAQGPFALFDGDMGADIAARVRSQIEEVRAQVTELAEMAGVSTRPLSVRRRISSAASYAWTVAEELTSRKLASSGEIGAEAAAEISAKADRLAQSFLRLAREVDSAGAAASDVGATSR